MKEIYSSEQEEIASRFVAAIKEIAGKEENLNNLESYLTYHFSTWMQKFANTPAGLMGEMEQFAKMEF